MITNPFYLLIVFFGIISGVLILITRFKTAAKIPPVILILFLSALLANTGIIPTDSGFYKALAGYAVPFAVCQILLHVRFSDIKKTGLPMLKAFAVASAGSLAGCLVAGILLNNQVNGILDEQGWKLAGPYIGTYIGGSLNFFSMWEGLKINNPDLFAAANAIDNLTLIPNFIFWVIAPGLFRRWYPDADIHITEEHQQTAESSAVLKTNDLIILTLVGLLVMVSSDFLKRYLFDAWLPQMPAILIVTTLALLLAQFKNIKNLQGAKELGNITFYLFFAAIGAMMDIFKAVRLAPILFVYVVIIIVSQIVFTLSVGKLFKMDFRLLAVASLAAKAGPSTVVAYTNVKNWNYLALPGVGAAILGYAVANYVAWAGAYLLKFIVG